ncbi:hypothetical protein GOZ83_06840 [Agrobacterium vitis]|uniref:ORC-CDC6 family AAA ATPase n=1 Tax=Rhizobium/Agrobacterium group TaxID=227290 RepID=UPI0012E6F2DD|nr:MULTISPECIES: hypothetical protein [Rhizobium/Agrobacterium group]MCF1493032.1 hypothetical protein [Allorhizobium ampelinum]MVA44794.1 hypothetical protein [Agrobacterium vitis]
MSDFFYRTEDIGPKDILDFLVETEEDRAVIEQLKGRNPTVLIGSRGVGKSFLMRVAEQELLATYKDSGIVPVYVTFVSSSLLRTADPDQFRHWMLARLCAAILRAVRKLGLLASTPASANILAGLPAGHSDTAQLESLIKSYEASWKTPGQLVDASVVPGVEDVKYALEDLAEELGMHRFALFMDEAAHIFIPSQQRQFFTLFRDLRSHCITCNAAVYPGVTSYGDTFQPNHDATMISINRDVSAPTYIESMRRIVEKQADSKLLKNISKNQQNFATLAYAATGNPRILLKTVFSASAMSSSDLNGVFRAFYRSDIWSEHSALSEKYVGHAPVIDWGRNFIEDVVLPDLKKKNDGYLSNERNSSAYIWIHREAPESVKEALRILCYTGVLTEHASGMRGTRSEIGTRYLCNLGCLFALEANPAGSAFAIAKALTPKRMSEFGANHASYKSLTDHEAELGDIKEGFDLNEQLTKSNKVLDITSWQRDKLNGLGLLTVGGVLDAGEDKLKEAYYVGDKRARQMRNAALASVLEYLSG